MNDIVGSTGSTSYSINERSLAGPTTNPGMRAQWTAAAVCVITGQGKGGVMHRGTLIARAETLTELHARHRPLVLATVWDAWSSKTSVEARFSALTIGSHPLADSRGRGRSRGARPSRR